MLSHVRCPLLSAPLALLGARAPGDRRLLTVRVSLATSPVGLGKTRLLRADSLPKGSG